MFEQSRFCKIVRTFAKNSKHGQECRNPLKKNDKEKIQASIEFSDGFPDDRRRIGKTRRKALRFKV